MIGTIDRAGTSAPSPQPELTLINCGKSNNTSFYSRAGRLPRKPRTHSTVEYGYGSHGTPCGSATKEALVSLAPSRAWDCQRQQLSRRLAPEEPQMQRDTHNAFSFARQKTRPCSKQAIKGLRSRATTQRLSLPLPCGFAGQSTLHRAEALSSERNPITTESSNDGLWGDRTKQNIQGSMLEASGSQS